jgi:WD40 repeat protein
MQLKNGNLVSGGEDSQSKNWDSHLIVWKSKTEEPEFFDLFQVLRGHESDVNCIIQLDDDRIIRATKDKTIRIWKIDNVEENVKKILYNGRSLNKLSSWNVLFN